MKSIKRNVIGNLVIRGLIGSAQAVKCDCGGYIVVIIKTGGEAFNLGWANKEDARVFRSLDSVRSCLRSVKILTFSVIG